MIAAVLLASCRGAAPPVPAQPAPVRTGAEIEATAGFPHLKGRRVGLIVNQTARVGDRHLADLVHGTDGVTLQVLFGPEHGIRGDADAGAAVSDARDPGTGVPVISLYGSNRQPPADALLGVDVLVFDIQDVGSRFYTYISTMGLAMQAAAAADIPFVVLDRPNPLGGDRVDGFVLEAGRESFVGAYPIPVQHGLTIGELALMIVGERWLPGLDGLSLTVVPMEGWNRSMLWPDTGLEWIPTSPNIPDFETALIYAGTCFFEAVDASEGRGTDHPFRWLGAPWLDGAAAIAEAGRPEGITLRPIRFTPESLPGRATSPRFLQEPLSGIEIDVTDVAAVRPLALGVALLAAFAHQAPEGFVRRAGMARLAGTDRLADQIAGAVPFADIVSGWDAEVAAFRVRRTPYLLYE